MHVGSLLFEGVDQIDLTGPFGVLSRIPNATHRLYGKTSETVRDLKGLRLTSDAALSGALQLDVLHVPSGFGQKALMEDADVLAWRQTAGAHSVSSMVLDQARRSVQGITAQRGQTARRVAARLGVSVPE